jgi:hypothetical protein
VYVTEQLAPPRYGADGGGRGSKHELPPKSLEVKETAPIGVLLSPPELSAMVAVHVACVPVVTGLGEQLTLVEVERLVTVTVSLPPVGESEESPR